MKTKLFLAVVGCCVASMAGFLASAQESVSVSEEVVFVEQVPCKTHFYSNAGDNWYIQFGAGVNSLFGENYLPGEDAHHQLAVLYNVGFGKWFNPYVGMRLSFIGGPMHWQNGAFSKAKYVSGNLDFTWDMFNSFGGVNPGRVFSIVPFVGLGGTYSWDYRAAEQNCFNKRGRVRSNQWTLPVSAGLQLRFRLCRYVDFFVEGRAQFYADQFNNYVYGQPVDVSLSVVGGFSINIGGSGYKSYNPCDYTRYINSLNNQVNDLRGALANSQAALAAAEAQLPCPEVEQQAVAEVVEPTPLMATVRFKINSAVIEANEEVNVYNIAEWMKANPEQNVAIVGYADKDTGTAVYNMGLSQRRAEAVRDELVNGYGISPERLYIRAEGSSVQPYKENNWNRIVIFSVK